MISGKLRKNKENEKVIAYKWIIIFIVFSVILTTYPSYANNPNIINFKRTDYKAGNKNWSVSEDERGLMYVGNDLGLLEFDGIDWVLNTDTRTDLIRTVYAASYNQVFTGGFEEFGVWNRDVKGNLVYASLSDSLPSQSMYNDDIWRILESNDKVYFQSFKDIYVYDKKKVYKLPHWRNILLLTKVYEELWVQEIGGGLFRLVGDKYEKIEGSDFFSNTEVKIILPTKDKKYIIGTSTKGIYLYDGYQFSIWNNDTSLINSNLNCGIMANNGDYYFGSILDGVYELSPSGDVVNHFNTNTYLNNNTVLSMHEDKLGNIWLGLDRGISCIQYIDRVSCITDPSGRIGAVYSAALYKEKLFIGTNQGIYYINAAELNSMNAVSKFKFIPRTEGQVWGIYTIDDKLFCANNWGVFTIDENLNVAIPYKMQTGVFSIYRNGNYMYLGTYTGLNTIDKRQGVLHRVEEFAAPITRVNEDHLGNVWLQQMNKGVYKTKLNNELTRIEKSQYYDGRTSQGIYERLKLFKIGGRIAFLGDNAFFTYNDIDGVIVPEQALNKCFNSVGKLKDVVNISPNQFWVIGDQIVYNVKYKDGAASIISHIDIGAQNFSMVDRYENVVTLNDSLSLICLDNGFLLSKNITSISNVKKISTPFFRSVKALNTEGKNLYLEVGENSHNEIPYSYNTVEFKFSSIESFTYNGKFLYKLEGLDNKWSSLENANHITFQRLPKGKYSFVVKSVDRYGNSSSELNFSFEVLPVWYESGWAVCLYILFTFLVIVLISMFVQHVDRKKHRRQMRILETRRLSSQNERLQQEVEEKNAELLSQTSFIIQRNELLVNIKNEVDEFYKKLSNKTTMLPLFHKINNLLDSNLDAENDWKMFLIKFEQKHTTFFKNLKDAYPQLTINDLKLCACLKLNLDSKEIASLMNISVRAVENSRSRLRKKLDLSPGDQLNEFFIGL